MTPDELQDAERFLKPAEREELHRLLDVDAQAVEWRPLPGPQTLAFRSQADVIGFGGAAGGGKTDLAVGKALRAHHEVMILRREGTQMAGIIDRMVAILGTRDGYNGQDRVWRGAGVRGVQVEFGSTPNPGDEGKYQGRPHDLLVFDEAANFLESQVRFLLGWNRSTRQGVHSQALLTFNPPTNAEGLWIIAFFAPWLDKRHHLYPATPGELLHVATIPTPNGVSRDLWVPGPEPFVLVDGERVYDFDPTKFLKEDVITPQTRTFIPSRISDNPYLVNTGYLRQLQAMPEPLRSQMLYGDFHAGMGDDPWQVIPTAWVDIAMERWQPRTPRGEMMALGVDVARGGKDNTILSSRWLDKKTGNDMWFDELKVTPGAQTPSGQHVAGLVIAERRHQAPVHIDVIGVGASPYDLLREEQVDIYGVNVSERARGMDRTGRLTFLNQRAELIWRLREALDPENDTGIALPPDNELRAELLAPRWSMSGTKIKVESRDDIIERVGRSPDRLSALALALIATPKRRDMEQGVGEAAALNYDPYENMGR